MQNYQEPALELNSESKCLLSKPGLLHSINTVAAHVFTERMPDAPHVKLTSHVRVLNTNAMLTPLDCFFPEYMKTVDVQIERIDTVEETHCGTVSCILVKLSTPRGPFWVHALTVMDHIKLELIMELRPDQTTRLCIGTKYSGNPDPKPNLFLTHINPYTCALCACNHARMRKCRRCWEELRICVRYCGKDCQRAHFKLQHKYVCGYINV